MLIVPHFQNLSVPLFMTDSVYTNEIWTGIVSNNEHHHQANFTDFGTVNEPVYALSDTGGYTKMHFNEEIEGTEYDFDENDEMKFILNLKDRTISFRVNISYQSSI